MSTCRSARVETNIRSYSRALRPPPQDPRRGPDGTQARSTRYSDGTRTRRVRDSPAARTRLRRGSGGLAPGGLRRRRAPVGQSPPRRRVLTAVVRQRHPGHVAPESLEAVELARPRGEDVHDDVEEVDEDPLGLALALDARRTPRRAEPLADAVGDRLGLTGGGAGDEDEEVGVGDRLADGKDGDVAALLARRQAGDLERQGPGGVNLCVFGYCKSFAWRSEPTTTMMVSGGSCSPRRTTPRPSIARISRATPRLSAEAWIWVSR